MSQNLEHKFQVLEYKKVLGQKTFSPCSGNFFSQVLETFSPRFWKLLLSGSGKKQRKTQQRPYKGKIKPDGGEVTFNEDRTNPTKAKTRKQREPNENKTICPPKINDGLSGDKSQIDCTKESAFSRGNKVPVFTSV